MRRSSLKAGILLVLGLVVASTCALLILGPYDLDKALLAQMFLVCGAAALVFFLHFPQVGLLFVLVGGLLIAQRLGTGTQSGLNGAMLVIPVLTGVWLIHKFYRRREAPPVSSRSIVPLYVFMGVAVLAFIVGQYPWFPTVDSPITAQLAQLGIFLFSGLIFILAAQYLQDKQWLNWVVWLFLLIGAGHLGLRLVPTVRDQMRGLIPEVVQSGSMFWTWLVAMAFGQFLLNRDLRPLPRLVAGGIAATALGITMYQTRDWLSGWVPALVAVGVIVVLRYPRLSFLAVPLGAAAILVIGVSTFEGYVTGGDNLYSLETRGAAIQSLWPILSANPLLGLGPANYYSYTLLFPILGWYVNYSSHNNYLDLIAQTGFVGLGCFFWFAWSVGRTAWDLCHERLSGFDHAYVYGALGGLVATMGAAALGDWVIPFVYNTGFEGFRSSVLPWLFLGGMVALEQRVRRSA